MGGHAMPVDRIHEVERILIGSGLVCRKPYGLFGLFIPEFGRGEACVFFKQSIER